MPKYFLFILFLTCSMHLFSATILVNEPKAGQVFIELIGTNKSLNPSEFIHLKSSDFKKIKGHRLTLKEMILFKIAQRRIKKSIRKDGTIDLLAFHKKSSKPFKWHWGGFFLGMLVPIGFVITLFIKDEKRKDRITSALFGMAIVLAIGFLIGIMITASNVV